MAVDERQKATRPVTGWRIYYADGSTVDSTQSTWLLAPSLTVQCVVVFSDDQYNCFRPELGSAGEWRLENYRKVLYGHDYFWRDPSQGEWDAFDGGNATETPPGVEVKTGSLLGEEEFLAIANRAMTDLVWGG